MGKIKSRPVETGQRFNARLDVSEPSDDKQSPVFCLRHLQKGFSLPDCQTDEKVALVERLHKLCQLTWQELRQAPRKGFGYEIKLYSR